MEIFILFVLLAAVVLAWFLMRDQDGKLPWENRPETPLDLLKRLYAAGEISKEEYEKRKAVLEGREEE